MKYPRAACFACINRASSYRDAGSKVSVRYEFVYVVTQRPLKMARGQGKRLAAALRRFWQNQLQVVGANNAAFTGGARQMSTISWAALNHALEPLGALVSQQTAWVHRCICCL
jgi:hypothetical protein